MALCGHEGAAPSAGAARVAASADALAAELCVRNGRDVPVVDGSGLLGERAAILGLRRRGRVSPGGACRLLHAADGFLALQLARPDDRALLPAWLERDVVTEPWAAVTDALPERTAREWVARGRLLGLAVAEASAPGAATCSGVRLRRIGRPRERGPGRPRIVDLSSLWAGPLCTQLLGLAGARVVKVESTARPDGARLGSARFFDLLNAGKASVALDFTSPRGRDRLLRLLECADVVVEASRPRALRQLGIDAEALLAAAPGLVWVSITGYGREEPEASWVAFGDDAAVAAGLAVATGDAAAPIFCADAIADPLAGLAAAVATRRALERGGGCLIEVSLAGVARQALGPVAAAPARVTQREGAWWVECQGRSEPVAPPRARPAAGRARPLGADTAAL